jgi:hypothetical protein
MMVPGLSRFWNQVLLAVFCFVIALPLLYGHSEQPYRGLYRAFMGGVIGAAWGRGIHASLTWEDYGVAAVILLVIEMVALHVDGP